MTDTEIRLDRLRAGLIEGLRETRAVEREVFAALDPVARDTAPADGGWSAKDILAHLSAWRQRQTDRLVALREGREEPPAPGDRDRRHQRDLPRPSVPTGPGTGSPATPSRRPTACMAEVAAASDETLADPKLAGSILGNGPEHDLGHLAQLAPTEALRSRVLGLADATRAIVDRGGWPTRTAAYRALQPRLLPRPRRPSRRGPGAASPGTPRQRGAPRLAPDDDDLIALRDEIPALAAG